MPEERPANTFAQQLELYMLFNDWKLDFDVSSKLSFSPSLSRLPETLRGSGETLPGEEGRFVETYRYYSELVCSL